MCGKTVAATLQSGKTRCVLCQKERSAYAGWSQDKLATESVKLFINGETTAYTWTTSSDATSWGNLLLKTKCFWLLSISLSSQHPGTSGSVWRGWSICSKVGKIATRMGSTWWDRPLWQAISTKRSRTKSWQVVSMRLNWIKKLRSTNL